MSRTIATVLFLGTLAFTGCDSSGGVVNPLQISQDPRLRREVVGKWVMEDNDKTVYYTFKPDGNFAINISGKGFGGAILWMSGAGNLVGTWSISDEVLTIRMEGAEDKTLTALAKATGGETSGTDRMSISINNGTMTLKGKEAEVFKRVGQ